MAEEQPETRYKTPYELDDLNPPLRAAAGRWLPLVLRPSLASSLITFATLVGLGVVYRALPKDEAGVLALLLALIEILAHVGGLGMPTMITRLYSRYKSGTFDWVRDASITIALSAAPTCVAIVLLDLLFPLGSVQLAYLFAATVIIVGLRAIAFMLNSQGHHTLSSALIRLPNAFLALAALWSLAYPGGIRLGHALAVHLMGILLVFGMGILTLRHRYSMGGRRISMGERRDALIFLLAGGTLILPEPILIAIAGALLLPSEVAVFAAMAILLRPYKLLRAILSMIATPRLVRSPRISWRRMVYAIWGLAGLAWVATALFVPPLARWFYAGRFEEGFGFIPLLAIAGALHLTSVIPASYITARASTAFINRFTFTRAACMAALLILGGILIAGMRSLGLVISIILVELTTSALSYTFRWIFRSRDQIPIPAVE